MGFPVLRHHPELQTKWVNGYSGGDRNIVPVGLTDTDPDAVDSSNVVEYAAEMVADQFPDVADRIRQMNPENRDEMIRDQAQELLKSGQKLQKATGNLDKAWGVVLGDDAARRIGYCRWRVDE